MPGGWAPAITQGVNAAHDKGRTALCNHIQGVFFRKHMAQHCHLEYSPTTHTQCTHTHTHHTPILPSRGPGQSIESFQLTKSGWFWTLSHKQMDRCTDRHTQLPLCVCTNTASVYTVCMCTHYNYREYYILA